MLAENIKRFDPEIVRRDFPILHSTDSAKKPLAYFDSAASTQHPRQVIDAISSCYESAYANVHRGIYRLSELATENYEASRQAVQQLIRAQNPSEIIFTSGATASINLVAHAYGDSFLKSGDEILLSEMEHHSNMVPWFQLAKRVGAKVNFCPITEEGTIDLNQWQKSLTERTRIVAVTAVSNVLGTRNPIRAMVDMAHAKGARVLVDAAQSVPHEETDVLDWDADFVAFSGHKMLGPSGIGILYGKRELLESMPPFLGGGSMIDRVTWEGFTPGELPARFEAGTPPIAPAIALKAAIDYLQQIGLSAIQKHEETLTKMAFESLSKISGLRIIGPPAEQRAGIISFAIAGVNPQDLAKFLDFDGFALRAGHHCAMPLHQKYGLASTLRASFYLYNSESEVCRLAESIAKLAKRLRD